MYCKIQQIEEDEAKIQSISLWLSGTLSFGGRENCKAVRVWVIFFPHVLVSFLH